MGEYFADNGDEVDCNGYLIKTHDQSDPIWIPENKHGIEVGAYSNNEIVELLRDNCKKPKVIYFLADMLEE